MVRMSLLSVKLRRKEIYASFVVVPQIANVMVTVCESVEVRRRKH